MTCQELVELVTDYFEGTLEETHRDRFEAQLTVCHDCEHYVEQLRMTLRLAQDITGFEQRPEVASLLDAFREWHPDD
jgi:hypothetical protein